MTPICPKCNKKFYSIYTLNKHLNRKNPCDKVIQCDRCKKIFKKQCELDSHSKRKFPCKSPIEIQSATERELQLRLEIEKVKAEVKIQLTNKKMIMKEKELEVKAKQREINKEKILGAIEIIEARNAAAAKRGTAIELLKTERKEKTPQVIHNNITNNYIINVTQHIKKNCIDITTPTMSELPNIKNNFIETISLVDDDDPVDTDRKQKEIKRIFNDCKDGTAVVKEVIKSSFNNMRTPNMQFIFFYRPANKFFGIFDTPSLDYDVRVIEFNGDLLPTFTNTLLETFGIIVDDIPKCIKISKYYENDDDEKNYYKHLNLEQFKSNILPNIPNDIMSYSSDIFELDISEN